MLVVSLLENCNIGFKTDNQKLKMCIKTRVTFCKIIDVSNLQYFVNVLDYGFPKHESSPVVTSQEFLFRLLISSQNKVKPSVRLRSCNFSNRTTMFQE